MLSNRNIPGNVLITSISKKVPLINAVKDAASRINPSLKVFGADSNENVIGKYFVDSFWQMPLIKDLTTAAIIAFCKDNNVKVIIPSRDGELPFFADSKDSLNSNGIEVMISNVESVEKSLDKYKFYEHCCKTHINTIQTEKNIDLISSEKYVVKEQFGAGSKSLGLKLSKEVAITQSKHINVPVFQPFVEGSEFSIDVYIQRNGNIKGIIIRKRALVENGESQITYNVIHKKLEECCRAFVNSLQFKGHIVLQAIVDKTDIPFLLECNARFGGASNFSIKCGLDSFYWFLSECEGHDVSSFSFDYNEANRYTQVRYMADKFIVIDGVGV